MLLTPLMNGQAFLRPHTHTTQATLSVKPRPSIRAGSCWSQAWRRAVGPPPVQGSWRPHTLTQASPLTLSGQASVCFPFKSTTERTPTCFLNKASITGLWKVSDSQGIWRVCVRVWSTVVFFPFFLYCCRKLESCRQAPRRKQKPQRQRTTWPSLLDSLPNAS